MRRVVRRTRPGTARCVSGPASDEGWAGAWPQPHPFPSRAMIALVPAPPPGRRVQIGADIGPVPWSRTVLRAVQTEIGEATRSSIPVPGHDRTRPGAAAWPPRPDWGRYWAGSLVTDCVAGCADRSDAETTGNAGNKASGKGLSMRSTTEPTWQAGRWTSW